VVTLGEHGVEELDLPGGAGVAVEEEPAPRVVPAEPVAHDRVGDLVGHVAARGEDLLHLLAELGPVLDVGPEDVAGGDGGDGVLLGDPGGLGALARPGWTHDDQTQVGWHQRRNPS